MVLVRVILQENEVKDMQIGKGVGRFDFFLFFCVFKQFPFFKQTKLFTYLFINLKARVTETDLPSVLLMFQMPSTARVRLG